MLCPAWMHLGLPHSLTPVSSFPVVDYPVSSGDEVTEFLFTHMGELDCGLGLGHGANLQSESVDGNIHTLCTPCHSKKKKKDYTSATRCISSSYTCGMSHACLVLSDQFLCSSLLNL